jgi:hypothetical protein
MAETERSCPVQSCPLCGGGHGRDDRDLGWYFVCGCGYAVVWRAWDRLDAPPGLAEILDGTFERRMKEALAKEAGTV